MAQQRIGQTRASERKGEKTVRGRPGTRRVSRSCLGMRFCASSNEQVTGLLAAGNRCEVEGRALVLVLGLISARPSEEARGSRKRTNRYEYKIETRYMRSYRERTAVRRA